MSLYLLAFVRYDFIFLTLILGLYGILLFNRSFLGFNNELLGRVMFENSRVVFFMLSGGYAWDVYLQGSGDAAVVAASTAFFLGGFSLALLKAFLIIAASCLVVLAESFFFSAGRYMAPEFPIFFLISIYAAFGAIQSADLMTMVLFMEILSYCLFVMPILFKVTNLTVEAVLKYYVLGSFSSGFLLMGTGLVYAAYGTVVYSSLALLLSGEQPALALGFLDSLMHGTFMNLGFIFIFSALFFKLGLVPFHYWVRDVYEGAP